MPRQSTAPQEIPLEGFTPHNRRALVRELPSLPATVAETADASFLVMLCAAWLDNDERLGVSDYEEDDE